MSYQNIREEELKNKIAHDYFWLYDCSQIIGNVDFCVTIHQEGVQIFEQESLLWAEAKRGIADIDKSLSQLILTIGKARTFDQFLPPPYLGALDSEKIAFIPYSDIHDIFYLNDFNWNVTPSNYDTKEFKLVYDRVKKILDEKALLYYYDKHDKDLKSFIKSNFVVGKMGTTKIRIDKNNFMVVYNKWLTVVKPTIAVNWDLAKKTGIIDGDFYLADLLSRNNESLKKSLFVLLKTNFYELDRKIDEAGMFHTSRTEFNDKQKAHNQFWNKYERPPKEEYWDYIVDRRDLLVPQDVRERKGSYYTPQIWVELSQKYIADVLGEDWQDEYYVWDCAAGTGNLLAGLTNKYNIWASTLDKQDVDVMHDRIDNMNKNSPNGDGSNLLHDHMFQFDFLNDDFSKLPKPLKDIIDDEEKRKKLVVYINPPYAESGNKDVISGRGSNKSAVALSKTYAKYQSVVGTATRELFAQFITRIYAEIPLCKIANFSTLKNLQSSNFSNFRTFFRASLEKIFLVPADTFDNVKGQFPIAFYVWDTNKKEIFDGTVADVYDRNAKFSGTKTIHSISKGSLSVDWLRQYFDKKKELIGYLRLHRNDIQNKDAIFITSNPSKSDFDKKEVANITLRD